jgi:hypothetical protein
LVVLVQSHEQERFIRDETDDRATRRNPVPVESDAAQNEGDATKQFRQRCFNGQNEGMASYSVNVDAVAQARRLIDAHQYVLESVWGDVQPTADDENAFLESHSWTEYAAWHLGLTDGAGDDTKARYAFVYGDLRRVHRMGLIACQYRAAEWRHKEIELAAHQLLQHLDNTRA